MGREGDRSGRPRWWPAVVLAALLVAALGWVWLVGDPLVQAPEPARVTAASVTFEPCARSNWHTHPLGQTLIVAAGCGLVQSSGGPVRKIRPGDVVWCGGARAATTHIAVQEHLNGKNVDWLERVTDEQFAKSESAE